MDKKCDGKSQSQSQSWVGTMYQRFEAVCHEVDEYVNKEPVNYADHMQSVGESMKKFYCGFLQDYLPPLVAPVQQFIPPKQSNSVNPSTSTKEGIKEITVDNDNTNNSEEGPSDNSIQVHLNSSTSNQEIFEVEESSCKDEKNSSEAFIDSGCIDETCDEDHSAKISHESTQNRFDIQHFKEYSESNSSLFEDADWGIEPIIDLNVDINKEIEEEKSEQLPMETLENEPLLNKSIDELESDLNTSNVHQLALITCNEDKEEKTHASLSDLLKLFKSRNSCVEQDTIYASPTESMDCFSASSRTLSSCESFGALHHDNINDSTRFASSKFLLSNGAEDVEDLIMETIDLSDKKQLVESCVFVEDKNLFGVPNMTKRSKSYKKIIKDAFTSRKRLTNEYKQIAVLYGDIDKEFRKPTEENARLKPKSAAQDFADSEWEFV